jgi:predicted DNA-binding transcriptional regulator AlpA
MINRGHFPGPVRILLRGVRWRESEVLEWIASREKATPDIKMLQME